MHYLCLTLEHRRNAQRCQFPSASTSHPANFTPNPVHFQTHTLTFTPRQYSVHRHCFEVLSPALRPAACRRLDASRTPEGPRLCTFDVLTGIVQSKMHAIQRQRLEQEMLLHICLRTQTLLPTSPRIHTIKAACARKLSCPHRSEISLYYLRRHLLCRLETSSRRCAQSAPHCLPSSCFRHLPASPPMPAAPC